MSWRDDLKLFFTSTIMRLLQSREKNDTAKTKVSMEASLNTDPITEMISSYKKSEENWITSSMNREQEIACRLNFMQTHREELQKVNALLLKEKSPERQNIMKDIIDSLGISELMKDYNAVYSKDNQPAYICANQNDIAATFRQALSDTAEKQNLVDTPVEPGMAAFQKLLISKQGYGLDGSNRPFVDNFISLPEKTKLKVMYALENDVGSEPVTDEMIQDYHPDGDKVISTVQTARWRFLRRLTSTDMDFHKIKATLEKVEADEAALQQQKAEEQAKENAPAEENAPEEKAPEEKAPEQEKAPEEKAPEQEIVIEQEEAPEEKAPEEDMPQLKDTKRHKIDDFADKATGKLLVGSLVSPLVGLGAGVLGGVGTGVVIGIKAGKTAGVEAGLAAGKAMTELGGAVAGVLGVGLTAVMVGKNVADLAVNKKNEIALEKASNQIAYLKKVTKQMKLKPEQSEAISHLENGLKAVKSLNVAKGRTLAVDAVVNGISIAGCCAGETGSILIGLGAYAVGEYAKGKLENVSTREIVDNDVCKNKEEFTLKKAKASFHVSERFSRLPKKLQEKYSKAYTKFNSDDEVVKQSLREQAVRENGTVDLNGLKNKIIYDISDKTYMLLRNQALKKAEKSQDPVDMMIENVATTMVKAAGGKTIDFSAMTNLATEAKPQEREFVAKDLSERAMDMSRG